MAKFSFVRHLFARSLPPILAAACLISVQPVAAQNYTYKYTSDNPAKTYGSFTITGLPGSYSLSMFSGFVDGVKYDTSSVGIRRGSGGDYGIYLGGLVNGVDTPIYGTNDFEQVRTFVPGVSGFSDLFYYIGISSNPSLVAVSAALADFGKYTYAYTSADPKTTSGFFTISGAPGAYSLSDFVGTIGGIKYDTSSVGIRQGSAGFGVYLGGLINGVDTPVSGSLDFEQVGTFIPGIGGFSDVFSYFGMSSNPSSVSVSVALATAASYTYDFTSSDPRNTSGHFTISGAAGAYSLSDFVGKIAGVEYNTSTVGIRQGTGGTYGIYLGGLVNGIDTPISYTNDFEQVRTFIPGVSNFSDFFSYTKPGSNFSEIAVNFSLTPGLVPKSAVPEPATWAMMMLGFGCTGYAMRSRRKRIHRSTRILFFGKA